MKLVLTVGADVNHESQIRTALEIAKVWCYVKIVVVFLVAEAIDDNDVETNNSSSVQRRSRITILALA